MAQLVVIGSGWGTRVQVPTFREAGLDVLSFRGHDWHSAVGSEAELVVITTPPVTHVEIALAALAAGKHVLCEKPTAVSVSEAERLVAAARERADRITLIDQELRFLPSFIEAWDRVARLGGVRYIEARYSSPSRGDRQREWTWWSDAAQGGGVWGAVGSHFVDAIRYLTRHEVVAAQASVNTIIAERSGHAVTSDEFTAVHLRLDTGAIAAMTFSAVATGPDEPSVITIHCEDGALRLTAAELLFAKRAEPFVRVAGEDLVQRPGNSMGGAFATGTLHLGRALKRALDDGDRSGLAAAATFDDGLAQQRVLDAARASEANDGRWMGV
jgi:predicted dehydrogenase